MAIRTIINKVNNCVGCPPEMGCRGKSCPNYPHTEIHRALCCDACNREIDTKSGEMVCLSPYQKESSYICEDCLNKKLKWFGLEDFI